MSSPRHLLILAVTISVLLWIPAQAEAAPLHIYLTWQGDTSTTMTVNVQTATPDNITLRYDTTTQGGIPASYSQIQTGSTHQIPGLDTYVTRYIHTVELTGLAPGQVYYAIAGDAVNGYSPEFQFRTTPMDEPLTFITGGDFDAVAATETMLIQAATHDPNFAVLGGDVAYVNGNLAQFAKWDTFLDWWELHMVTSTGNMIPLILAIGNHEVVLGYDQFADPTGSAPFFFGYFAQSGAGFSEPRQAYFQRSFGSHTSLYILDTSHVTPIQTQAAWLTQQLQTDEHRYKFAAYHFPMYPSHRSFSGPTPTALRTSWRPLFEAYHFVACFENHDHILKRTFPLTNNAPDPNGVLYLGDGCFGRPPRAGDQAQRLDDPITYPNELSSLGLSTSYLAHWESTNHFWVVTIPAGDPQNTQNISFQAYTETGTLLDITQVATGAFVALPLNQLLIATLAAMMILFIVQKFRTRR
jgi:Purple acid Phosphatase, N-terminal domain/Calcineurin-like phosphoesterase